MGSTVLSYLSHWLAWLRRQLAGMPIVLFAMLGPLLTVLLVGLFVFLGFHVHPALYWGCLAVFPLQWVVLTYNRRKRERRVRNEVRAIWHRQDDDEEDFDWLCDEYVHWRGDLQEGILLDDRTWDDLEMDGVFSRMDRTLTSLGEVTLYALLRTPVARARPLEERACLIRLFETDETTREAVQIELHRLGKTRRFRIDDLEGDSQERRAPLRLASRLLALLAVLSLAVLALFPKAMVLVAVAPLFLLNLVVTSWFRWRVHWQADAFLYVSAAISCAMRIGRIRHEAIRRQTERLATLSASTSVICKKARTFGRTQGVSIELFDLVADYVRAFFLRDVLDYFHLVELVRKHRSALRELLIGIGELDALQSAASFRERLPVCTEPVFAEQGISLALDGGRHPLLENAVPNSIALDSKNAFLTGSNTSGKSTFLRTVAINALMAQTVSTACAVSYRASFFRLLSSITTVDDLMESKSLYQVEAERLLKIIKAADELPPALCLIDEPLKGTNLPEGLSATIEMLRYLGAKPILLLVASHHVQIAHELGAKYQVFHFPDPVPGDQSGRNYTLKPGPDYDYNGIKTLERLGYPPEIVAGALNRLQDIFGKPGQ